MYGFQRFPKKPISICEILATESSPRLRSDQEERFNRREMNGQSSSCDWNRAVKPVPNRWQPTD